jgi:hypothetical protein
MSEQRDEMTDETTDEREYERSTEDSDTSSPDEGVRGHGGEMAVEDRPSETRQVGGGDAASDEDGAERAPLLADDNAQSFRQRWDDLQAGFVDHPREVVEEADDLVSKLMEEISTGFSERRSSLEAQWERGDDVSTEDLRIALTRYRSFFNRLLSA